MQKGLREKDLEISFCFILDINFQNVNTKWTPLHAATFQEHGKVSFKSYHVTLLLF